MEVIATKVGYHGKLREPGDTFEVPEGATASWFEPTQKPEAVTQKPEAVTQKAASKPTGKKHVDDLV